MASLEDADDAVAEAYAIAWRRQHDIPRGAELGWLIGVTRRVLANARRSGRRAGALHALLELSPLDREAVVLTVWFDISSADAACACSATRARSRRSSSRP